MNDKWWSILFAVVMIGCGAMFVVAPFVGMWLPQWHSEHGWDIIFLFYLILAITGFFFILTEALLVAFMFRFASAAPGTVRRASLWAPVFKPLYKVFNTSQRIEIGWTIVPAIILLYLAFAQIDTWAEVKYKSILKRDVWGKQDKGMPLQVAISARQFEWRIRYPSPSTWERWKKQTKNDNTKVVDDWVKNLEFDDIYVPNDLHVIQGRNVVIQLSTKDVLHSFNMPHMLVKQDALPGKTIPVWFKPINSNVHKDKDKDGKPIWQDGGGRDPETGIPNDIKLVWQIACAELCGWGHYRMIGRAFVHPDEADFLAWLEAEQAKQNDFGTTEQKK